MRVRRVVPVLAFVALGVPTSCSSSSSTSESGLPGTPSCDPDTVKIVGTIDGTDVSGSYSLSGGVNQLASPPYLEFMLGTNGKVHLTWPSAVADGALTDATGTFVTASAATFCAGGGTKVLLTRTSGATSGAFVLTGLTGSPSCKGAVTGTVNGCFQFPAH